MIPTIQHSGKGKTMERIKISVVLPVRQGQKRDGQHTEEFQSSEEILCDTLQVDTYHYTFVQTRNVHHQ